jgi:iron complex outermembrane receptor protein
LNLNDLALTQAETEQNPINYSPETLAKFDAYRRGPVTLDVGKTQLRAWDALASKEVWETENGPVSVGLGLNYRSESIRYHSPSISEERPPYSAERHNTALFAELQAPITERLEATLSSRLDHYSDFGSITTSKLGGKWKQNDMLFFRGSVGTGFRAPTLGQMTSLRMRLYDEPVDGNWTPVYFSGNPNLQPEKSTQTNFGFRLEPSKQWTLGMDWWQLQIKDTFSFYNGPSILNDPELHSKYLISDGTNTYIIAPNLNTGHSRTSGIDYDVQWRKPTDWGVFRWTLKGTYFIQSERQYSNNSAYVSDLGKYSGLTDSVTPRHQWTMRGILEQGTWSTSATINYRSGNTENTTLENLDGERVPFFYKVPAYWTLDLGARWAIRSNLNLGVTVNNVMDTLPPLRLLTSGLLQGVDTRYANYYGRTLKLKMEYKF